MDPKFNRNVDDICTHVSLDTLVSSRSDEAVMDPNVTSDDKTKCGSWYKITACGLLTQT